MTMTKDGSKHPTHEEALKIQGIDHVEIYVGNANHAAHFYRTTMGFNPVAYRGLETGERDRVSYMIEQGSIRLMLTAALSADSPVAEHVRTHGDGVKDIALRVEDAARAFELAVSRGAEPVLEPTVFNGDSGRIVRATIKTFGQTVHSFVERKGEALPLFPNFHPMPSKRPALRPGLTQIDHVAVSVERGELDRWVEFYRHVLGFEQSHEESVSTGLTAMNSKVVQDSAGRVKFPITEPAPARRRSQIEEYLAFHKGPGAQHVALLSEDIVETVGLMREHNIEFLSTPAAYYGLLEKRVGRIEEEIQSLRELNILVDRDEWGYLLQIFTRPLQSRPTLFFEVIQRAGARGFGGGNIKALFEAIEREQAMRGNL